MGWVTPKHLLPLRDQKRAALKEIFWSEGLGPKTHLSGREGEQGCQWGF